MCVFRLETEWKLKMWSENVACGVTLRKTRKDFKNSIQKYFKFGNVSINFSRVSVIKIPYSRKESLSIFFITSPCDHVSEKIAAIALQI